MHHTTLNIQRATHNIQRATYDGATHDDAAHATCNAQRAPYDRSMVKSTRRGRCVLRRHIAPRHTLPISVSAPLHYRTLYTHSYWTTECAYAAQYPSQYAVCMPRLHATTRLTVRQLATNVGLFAGIAAHVVRCALRVVPYAFAGGRQVCRQLQEHGAQGQS